jgi:hypothetical protein
MSRLLARRPSASLIVSIIALAVAMSGSAVAATTLATHPTKHKTTKKKSAKAPLTKGDKLIAKSSLSGNRLRRHTLTKTQINLKKLGTVPKAKAALTAQTAVNATKLGGQPASYYEDAAGRTGTKGIITATGIPTGTTVPLFTTGPFTISMTCVTTAAGTGLNLTATSTIAGSDLNGTLNVPAATAVDLGPTVDIAATGAPATADDVTMDFEAPGGAQAIVSGATGVNSLGVGCWANFAGIA